MTTANWQKEGIPVVAEKMAILVNDRYMAASVLHEGELYYYASMPLYEPLWKNTDPLYDFMAKHSPLRATFSHVYVIINESDEVIIPDEYYEPFQEEKYFKWIYQQGRDLSYKHSQVAPQVKAIVRMPQDLYYPLFAKFSDAEFKGVVSVVAAKSIASRGKMILLRDEGTIYAAYSADGQQALFYNCFKAKSINEITFFVSTLCDQHGLDRAKLTGTFYANLNGEEEKFMKQFLPGFSVVNNQPVSGHNDFPQVFNLV